MDKKDVLEKSLDDLSEEITCPVCHEHFQDPKILPCLHYYCKECIRGLATAAQSSRETGFSCPECRQDSLVPHKDPDLLPTAFFVNRMKDLYEKMEKAQEKDASETACEMCSGAKAEAFCRHCTYFICGECVRSHQKMRVFATHKVEELKEGRILPRTPRGTRNLTCSEHDERLKFFCFSCNCLVCRDCTVIDHYGHNYKYVRNCAPECKQSLVKGLAPLKELQQGVKNGLEEVEAVEREIADQHTSVSDTIKESFVVLFDTLEQRKQYLLKKASDLAEEKLDVLASQKKELQISLSEIQSLVEFVERRLTSATNEELMSLHKQLLTRVQESCKKYDKIQLEPESGANMSAEVPNNLPLNIGRVYLATSCSVEGGGIKSAEVMKLANFMIYTSYPNGRPCKDRQIVEARLVSLVDSSIVQASVVEITSGRGIYKATYTPKIRGRHTLSIKLNGKEIPSGPFQVFVRIHPTQISPKPVRVISGVLMPSAITFNSKHQLVVSEYNDRRVSVLDSIGRKLKTIQCDKLGHPAGVSLDSDDYIYVTDPDQAGLFKFNKEGQLIKHIQKKGKHPGSFNYPISVLVIKDRVYVSDSNNHRIQVLDTDLNYVKCFGSRGSGSGQFNHPYDITQDKAGNLYVTDDGNNRVQVFDREGRVLREFSEKGCLSQKLRGPTGIWYTSEQSGEFIYVTEWNTRCVSVFKPDGEFVTCFGEFQRPSGIAVDMDGFVYVCENQYGYNNMIYVF